MPLARDAPKDGQHRLAPQTDLAPLTRVGSVVMKTALAAVEPVLHAALPTRGALTLLIWLSPHPHRSRH
ncbi:hypothetical protein, partial [Vibrio alginolyticus]|uniref:hypothetical protein n=1 Tax=Vibrio alginolyticus TaxID=663 RepID=UPI001EEB8BA7